MDFSVTVVLAITLILNPQSSVCYRDQEVDGYFVARDPVKSDPSVTNTEHSDQFNNLPASRQVQMIGFCVL